MQVAPCPWARDAGVVKEVFCLKTTLSTVPCGSTFKPRRRWPGQHLVNSHVAPEFQRRVLIYGVLILIEVSDVVFAVDSIPAIFAITTDPFIVFTSNIFAILGLRALYFLLADVADRFHLLKYGLAMVLTSSAPRC